VFRSTWDHHMEKRECGCNVLSKEVTVMALVDEDKIY
jgi:hypothetical protein